MLRGWKNIYGVFKLLDLSHGSENKKFPDDGSDPVEYPDGTGGFLSGELRIQMCIRDSSVPEGGDIRGKFVSFEGTE